MTDSEINGGHAFKVAVFTYPGKRGPRFNAYTMWYSEQWDGYCGHKVVAPNGRLAKRAAIEEHKARCIPTASPDRDPAQDDEKET